jgi:hypothetical protein
MSILETAHTSSLLRWQANMWSYIATTDLCRQMYVVILRVFDLFCC